MSRVLNLGFVGQLDWGEWSMGLVAAIVGGGAGSVASAFSLIVIAPDSFNMAHPALMIKAMLTMFIVNGLISGFAFLRNKPVPTVKEVTHTETTITGSAPATVTVKEEKTTETTVPPPAVTK